MSCRAKRFQLTNYCTSVVRCPGARGRAFLCVGGMGGKTYPTPLNLWVTLANDSSRHSLDDPDPARFTSNQEPKQWNFTVPEAVRWPSKRLSSPPPSRPEPEDWLPSEGDDAAMGPQSLEWQEMSGTMWEHDDHTTTEWGVCASAPVHVRTS